jgi:hypothetical protein
MPIQLQDADRDAQHQYGDVSQVSQLIAVRSQCWRTQLDAQVGKDTRTLPNMKANRDG